MFELFIKGNGTKTIVVLELLQLSNEEFCALCADSSTGNLSMINLNELVKKYGFNKKQVKQW